MRILNTFIICFLSFCFLNSDSKLSALELGDQPWAPNCVKLKKDFLIDRSLDVIFTKKPNLMDKQTHWTLTWHNIGVLIPNTKYKDIYISINNRNEYEILLNTIDGVIISLMVSEDNEIEDVFAKTSFNGEVLSTPKGVMTTKDLFGGPVKLSTIMKLAYKSTPALLTCMEDNRIQESAIASALILKDTATDNLVAAYDGIGAYDGWITKSKEENNIEYTLNILSANTDNQLLHINYRITEGSKYEYLPFWVGNKLEHDKGTVIWLRSLNNALEMKTNDSWKEFIADARESGISEKSISGTCDKLKIKPYPDVSHHRAMKRRPACEHWLYLH